MSNEAAAPPRNAPCPCGSGRRYKHCCGGNPGTETQTAPAHYMGWDVFTPDERAQLWQMMLKALDAHRQFRLDLARPLYEEVVARAPLTFDAVHMLGVVRLMEGDLDEAESLLTRARELAPDVPSIQHNLRMLAHRRQEHEGLYSVRTIVATDMLRLFGAAGGCVSPAAGDPFAPAATGAPYHIVVPGDAANAGSNRTGFALAQRLGGAATLWSGLDGDVALAAAAAARLLGEERTMQPAGGTLALFGLNVRTLAWLPEVAATFDAIVIALDAHDPAACVDLLGRLPPEVLGRVRFVARCAALLDDLGLPGAVDAMLFDTRRRRHRRARVGARPRIGVFMPALGDFEDVARWRMLEWLRERRAFLRVLYAGRLPSPHLPDADEHLVGLATHWEGWHDDLDALFFWGAEGRMRQYDRLVFEAVAAGLPVVADGFGDFGAALAARANCAQFFDPATACSALEALFAQLAAAEATEVAA
jgi:hypothetical protein